MAIANQLRNIHAIRTGQQKRTVKKGKLTTVKGKSSLSSHLHSRIKTNLSKSRKVYLALLYFYLVEIVRPAAMIGSGIGVSWSLVSYQKALRLSYNRKERKLSLLGVIFYYIWKSCEVAPRIILLSLSAAQFGYHMLVATCIHWILMSLWIGRQNQEMYDKMRDKIVHYIVIGYVLIFCFQNVQKGKTRYRAMFYYFVTFVENIIMLTLWTYFTHHKREWVYLAVIVSVPSCMVIQIIVQILYYKCVHPEHTNIWLC